jgi:hypothetical protein
MVKLGMQDALLFLHPFALGHVDIHANHPLRLPIAIV